MCVCVYIYIYTHTVCVCMHIWTYQCRYIILNIYIWSSLILKCLYIYTAMLIHSCPTLCHPIDGSSPGSPVPGILQARTLEWVAISFSNVWKWKVKVNSLSHVWLLVTPGSAAYQGPPSMGFSRQEYWSGVSLPSPYIYTVCVYMRIWT